MRAMSLNECHALSADDDRIAVDVFEASRMTGIPVATLNTLRSRGGGPIFSKPTPGTVRYLKSDLIDWLNAKIYRAVGCPLNRESQDGVH